MGESGNLTGNEENTNKDKSNFDIGNINWDNFRNILLDVLKKYVTPAITLYATITELKKMIKEHNLEDKLDKAIEEFKKNNKQNSNKNNQESAADVLYKDSKIKEQKEKQESEYKLL